MISHEWSPVVGRRGFALLLSAWGLTGRAVEIGTHRGEYANDLLHNWPGSLLCVDPWVVYYEYPGVESSLAGLGGTGDREEDMRACVRTLSKYGDRVSYLRMTSADAAPQVEDGSFDFVYIDGNHAPEHVRQDLELWWPKVRPGGILAGHDYSSPNEPNGVPGSWVRPEVDRFARENNLTVYVVREFGDAPWSFYLIKPLPPQPEGTNDGDGGTRPDGPAGTPAEG